MGLNLAEIQFFLGGGGGGGGGGRRYVCFWMHFFLQIFEHFSSTPLIPTTPHPPLEYRGWRGKWVGVGDYGLFLDCFLEFLEGV